MATAVDHTDTKGAFMRKQSKHRHVISQDNKEYPPESGRYHLHIALACPWANGALAVMKLKGLDDAISYSVVHPTWQKTRPDDDSDEHRGWVYKSPGDSPLSNSLGYGSFDCDDLLSPDELTKAKSIREVYNMCGDEEGPFTTPILYDKKTNTIVNNESTDIMKMINNEFNEFAKNPDLDLYPEDLQKELQELNDDLVYPKVNNGVYRSGFAKSQEAYNTAVNEVFESLEILEEKLSKARYLGGDRFTWLDLRLFMTLVRFDPVYITYFKTNKKRVVDYPNLLGFVRDVYSMPEIKDVISIKHIKTHYFTSHPTLNHYAIIPTYDGPDLTVPSGRENMK
eukprot:scaffold328_cov130-Cylindrotheca_fusiformis.AAC.30